MKFLLDTHVLLWALSEPEKLSEQARIALEETENELRISSISLFEVATKSRLGKLQVPPSLLNDWQFVISRLGASMLTLDGAEAVQAGRWKVKHRDPFDRLLAAQAVENDLVLISKDRALRQFRKLQVLW